MNNGTSTSNSQVSMIGMHGNITGKVTLFRDPLSNLEAASKQYIDRITTNIDSSKVKTGTLQINTFPGFTGDIVAAQGTGRLDLTTTGVTPGSYNKITINDKGRVSVGRDLVEADIPNISYGKITTGKPNSIATFGITDALSKTGGSLLGYLNLNNIPTAALQAANKQYTDSKAGGGSDYNVGNILIRPVSITPSGYLRCNGSEISKTTYSALYAAMGDVFSRLNPVQSGGGRPWQQQYDINTYSSTAIAAWSTNTNFPIALTKATGFITNNYAYVVGGYNATGDVANYNTYRAPINSDGTLGAWADTGKNITNALFYSQAVVIKNKVYLLGSGLSGSYTTNIMVATIADNGTLGAWSYYAPLPTAVGNTQAIVTNSKLYFMGGINTGNHISDIYYTPIASNGTLGKWTRVGNLPVTVSSAQLVSTKGRLYLIGGYVGATSTQTTSVTLSSVVYTCVVNSDGTLGTWTTATSLPIPIAFGHSYTTRNKVFILGGFTYSGVNSNIYSAPVNADGTLGSWSLETVTLPDGGVQDGVLFVTSSKICLVTGYTGAKGIYSYSFYQSSYYGGSNDYSPYYTVDLTPTNPLNFRLPDYSSKEVSGFYYYIKY